MADDTTSNYDAKNIWANIDTKDLKFSTADLEDTLLDMNGSNKDGNSNDFSKDAARGGDAIDQYQRLGSFATPDAMNEYFTNILSESYRLAGSGRSDHVLQNFLSRLDRHGTAIAPVNSMNYGYTFITRPRLNLSEANLVQHPQLQALRSSDEPNSVSFMIRMLLDSRLGTGRSVMNYAGPNIDNESTEIFNKVLESGLVDIKNPFFTPLCNGLVGLSGFPDFNLETETTEGDYHSGDFTFAKGSDMNNRTQELSLEFKDVQGSIILTCIYYWCLVIAMQAKGTIMAYPDDIYEQRLNYTVSIYRFITDPARKTILWWGKATGCFPKSVPIGALFNVNQGEVTISSAQRFSIPFTANDIKINDPGILMDFNGLVRSYVGGSFSSDPFGAGSDWETVPDGDQISAGLNFVGLPYIENNASGELNLVWKTRAEYLEREGYASKVADINKQVLTDYSNQDVQISDNKTMSFEQAVSLLNDMYTSEADDSTANGSM